MQRFNSSAMESSVSFSSSGICFSPPFFLQSRRGSTSLDFRRKHRRIVVSASKEEPKLDPWDQMELKFGKMIGEDPKLTLAKIMARKSNPGTSYLEIEKTFEKKGKAMNKEIQEVKFDLEDAKKPLNSRNELNLVKPVPKKGIKFEVGDKVVKGEDRKEGGKVNKPVENSKLSVPNAILRKPTLFNDDDSGNGKSSRFNIRPNLSLKMAKDKQERFTDITLLKKPQPLSENPSLDEVKTRYSGAQSDSADKNGDATLENVSVSGMRINDLSLSDKPNQMNVNINEDQEQESSGSSTVDNMVDDGSTNVDRYLEDLTSSSNRDFDKSLKSEDGNHIMAGLQQSDAPAAREVSVPSKLSEAKTAETNPVFDAALIGKPKRLDQSVKGISSIGLDVMTSTNYGKLENFLTSPIKQHEGNDWRRAEDLVKTGGRAEIELISSSTRGFVVSFGSLIGFLPYRNLAAKWKFLAFESWLGRKGLDPSLYKQNLGVIGSEEGTSGADLPEAMQNPKIDHKIEGEISADMKLEELLRIYDQEKLKFLSSFIGQKIKVNLVLADKKSRRLIFSIKPKEKEELVEKKRNLMAKLNVGDVVKCCIKKITYFGIFVEVEGVPALIHQTEVSWDATLDPASYFKIGQIVDAKVHQLDFSLERIFLSLKEITPDPLLEALEAVVGEHNYLDGRLEATEEDTEWADVESLIKELKQFEGIESVSKGRYFLSPGLAPTFQVYMASMFENQYKLLARSGNRVQEVIVQTSLRKEDMKSAILTCTNRVE